MDVVNNVNKYLNDSANNTIVNQALAGKYHTNGLQYDILGFPIFKGDNLIFDTKLKDSLLVALDDEQMKYCTMQLHEAIVRGEISESLFSEKQLQQIIDGKARIDKLTWHHHQATGKMQLVSSEVHGSANHTGGNAIWGEGVR